MKHSTLLVFLVSLLLSGCAELVVKEVDYANIKEIPEDASPAPIKFSNLRLLLPPGTEIGLESGMGPTLLGGFCSLTNYPVSRRVLSRKYEKQFLEASFENALESQGYDVTNQIDLDYGYEDELKRAEYFISVKVTDVDLDMCARGRATTFNIFNSAPGAKGKMYAKFEWSVYDALRRSTVLKITTEGYTRRDYPNVEAIELMFMDTFEMAAHNLGSHDDFYDLIVNGKKPSKDSLSYPYRKKPKPERPKIFDANEQVDIINPPLEKFPLPTHIDRTRQAAVLIQNTGHGSGVFITKEGHILTNAHVVGNADRTRVVTRGKKKKLIAEVLRVDKVRDVALLKVEELPDNFKIETLPIRTEKLTISEDVYAVGVPMDYRLLQDTVSKGIVSAHRLYKDDGVRLPYIQADVDVHGGSSGGSLLDEKGNLVGLTVQGMYMDDTKRSIGLNLFIPIAETLRALNITLNGYDVDEYPTGRDERETEGEESEISPPDDEPL